jgi:hypothetical protein
MRRRTRITLAAATLTLAALGGTYGLVAQQAIPTAGSTSVAAAAAVAAPSGGTSSTGTSSAANGATRSVLPPVTHTRTRAS